jgi:hypothetical protein
VSHDRNRAREYRLVFAELAVIAQSSRNLPVQRCNEVGQYVEHCATHVRAAANRTPWPGAGRLDYLGMVRRSVARQPAESARVCRRSGESTAPRGE